MPRILIAEDEWLVAFTLQGQLEELDCEVTGIAQDGREALKLHKETSPDAILMDICMPELDGIEATRRIMKENPTCVIILTARSERNLVAKAEKAGAMSYLVKPVSGAQILPAIEMAQRRFEEFLSLTQEVASLQDALTTRKLVERAKGILMERAHLSEKEAFRRLQKIAMDKRESLKTVTQRIIDTAESFDEFLKP